MSNNALPQSYSKLLFAFMAKQKWQFIVIQILTTAWALDTTLWPYLLGKVIDKISHYGVDKSHIWYDFAPILIFWGALWIVIEIMFRVSGYMIAKCYPELEAQMRCSMFDYVQQHSFGFFANNLAGTIAKRIDDMPQSSHRLLLSVQTTFIPAFLALGIALAIFFTINIGFAFLLLLFVIIHVGICLWTAPKATRLSDQHSEAASQLTGRVVDTFSNISTVKLFAARRFERQKIFTYQQQEKTYNQDTLYYLEKIKIYLGINGLIIPGVLSTWLMFYLWQHNQLSTGQFVLIFNTIWNLMLITWIVGLQLPSFFKEIGICQQAMKVIKVPHEIIDLPNAPNLKVTHGDIKFENVVFHYKQKNQRVFDHFNATILGGQKVGLVGFSGAGKSTFINLLLRFYDVQGGRIAIDDQDIKTVTSDSLRHAVSTIPQDPSLFHRSLMENIRYGMPQATDEEVINAAKAAHCHEFIMHSSEGYNTLVGERGLKLSGGQRQRIAIARAFLKNAPILILDEATSALDSVTEKYIHDSLESLMQNRTTIVVAHRLSTLSEMNRILVFEKGKIVEDGSHQELIKLDGRYAKMWHMQSMGFLPDETDEEEEEVEE